MEFRAPRRPQIDERSAWVLVTAVVGAIAVLKGLRLPNLWSATQLQIDYSFGFVKRGAAGALLHLLHVPIERYWVFAGLSFLLLVTAIALFVAFVRRRWAQPDVACYAAVFLSSFAVTYFVHIVGYVDVVLLALTVLALIVPRRGFPVALIYILCGAMTFLHESFLLSFFPLVWLGFFLDAVAGDQSGKRVALLHAVALPLVIAIETVLISLPQPMPAQQVSLMQAAIAAKVDFPVRSDFFDVMQTSALANVRGMMSRVRSFNWWIDEAEASLSLLWVALFFVWRSLVLLRTRAVPRKGLIAAAVVGASLCPMLLQLFGWDLYRWYAIAAFTAFMAYLLVAERLAALPETAPSRVPSKTLAFVLIAINLSTGAGLFDGYRVNTFPFMNDLVDQALAYRKLGHVPIPLR